MTLPILSVPTHVLKLPSTGKEYKFRPFLVKEEKILLLALQEGTLDALVRATKQIIEACTFGELDVDKLPTFDMEYVYLQLRIKSKGSRVALQFECTATDDLGNPCGHINSLDIDLETVSVDFPKDHSPKIMLTESAGIVMRHPTFENIFKLETVIKANDITLFYDMLPDFVESIFEGDRVDDNLSKEQIATFIDNLTSEQFRKIQAFFDTMPKLRKSDLALCCEKCKHSETIVLEGLQSFLE